MRIFRFDSLVRIKCSYKKIRIKRKIGRLSNIGQFIGLSAKILVLFHDNFVDANREKKHKGQDMLENKCFSWQILKKVNIL